MVLKKPITWPGTSAKTFWASSSGGAWGEEQILWWEGWSKRIQWLKAAAGQQWHTNTNEMSIHDCRTADTHWMFKTFTLFFVQLSNVAAPTVATPYISSCRQFYSNSSSAMSLKLLLDHISFHGSSWFDELLNVKCDNVSYLNLGFGGGQRGYRFLHF